MRKMQLAWEKIEAAKKPSEKKESFVDYYIKKRERERKKG